MFVESGLDQAENHNLLYYCCCCILSICIPIYIPFLYYYYSQRTKSRKVRTDAVFDIYRSFAPDDEVYTQFMEEVWQVTIETNIIDK